MVMFGLNQKEIANGYNNAAANPYDPIRDSGPSFYSGILAAPETGFQQGGAEIGQFLTGGSQHAQDVVNSLKPNPMTSGWLANVIQGVSSIVPSAIVGTIAAGGNPIGGALAVGETKGYSTMKELQSHGIDEATAVKVGTIEGIAQGAGMLVPASVGGNISTRIATGAGINVGIGAAERGATGKILEANGYKEQADQYRVLDGMQLLTDALIGGIFGAHGEGRKPLPSEIDAGLAANNIHQLEIESAPGIPADIATRNAHVNAMNLATEQVVRGEPVDVANKLPDTNFLPKSEVEFKAEVSQAVDDYLAEHQIVYHGTPHEFENFSLEKVGTGEGAAAYGHGLYFTDQKAIAENYRKTLSAEVFFKADGTVFDAVKELANPNVRHIFNKNGNIDEAIARAEQAIKSLEETTQGYKYAQADLVTLKALKESGGVGKREGRIYETKIPTDENMLHWDKPLNQQPEKVIKALEKANKIMVKEGSNLGDRLILGTKETKPLSDIVGGNIYRLAQDQLGGAKEASDYFNSLGIKGIKYPADMQRGKRGEAGHNYVVFDDKATQKVGADITKQIIAEKPDLKITDESGNVVTAQEALTKANEEISQAKKDKSVFEAAVNCFIRNGQ